jgi:predicted solute-binding protein
MLNPLKRHWKLFLVLFGSATIVTLFFFPPGDPQRVAAIFARNDPAKDGGVRVSLRADRNVLEKGDSENLVVEIRSDSEEVRNLQISIDAPGFAWKPDQLKVDSTIAPQTSKSYPISLEAAAGSGKYTITVFYHCDAPHCSSAITAGPIQLRAWYGEDAWVRFFRRLAQLIKDLTLPIVLAVLTYWFNKKQANREAERRSAETEAQRAYQELTSAREIERAKNEEAAQHVYQNLIRDREERQQVRGMILPLVKELAELHYMPIVRSARLLIIDHRNYLKQFPDTSLEKTLFNLLFLIKRMDYLRQTKGQIFFQSRMGEAIAANAWYVVREKFTLVIGDEQLGLAGKYIKVDDAFPDFAKQAPRFRKSVDRLNDWVAIHPKDMESCLRLVDLIQGVFRFEANRPFLNHWYAVQLDPVSEMEFEFARLALKEGNPSREQKMAALKSLVQNLELLKLSEGATSRLGDLQRDWPGYIENSV